MQPNVKGLTPAQAYWYGISQYEREARQLGTGLAQDAALPGKKRLADYIRENFRTPEDFLKKLGMDEAEVRQYLDNTTGGLAMDQKFIDAIKRGRMARDRYARDQGGEPGGEELMDLENMLKELIGEDHAGRVMKYIHDCRAASAQDQPPDFQGKPLTGGGMVPTTGTLSVDPGGSKSANAASAQDWVPPSMRKQYEDMAILRDGRSLRSYAERFPDAMRFRGA